MAGELVVIAARAFRLSGKMRCAMLRGREGVPVSMTREDLERLRHWSTSLNVVLPLHVRAMVEVEAHAAGLSAVVGVDPGQDLEARRRRVVVELLEIALRSRGWEWSDV